MKWIDRIVSGLIIMTALYAVLAIIALMVEIVLR